MKEYNLVIVGGGSAGLACAIEGYNLGIRKIVILEKEPCLGGILQQCIHNGFGLIQFNELLAGPEYAQRFIDKVSALDIDIKLNTYVISISKDKKVTYSNDSDGLVEINAKTIVMATGCVERTPGQIALEGDRVSGIFTAGQVQKYLNIDGYLVGKKVFILGSGDIGLIMARRMSLEGAKVLGVAELMPYSNGLTTNIVRCLNDFDIPLYLSSTIKKVIGKDHVEKVIVASVDNKGNYIEGSEKEFEVDTLILSVGLIPYNVILEDLDVKFSSTRGAIVDESYQTSIPGIFACGNALHVHDLVDFVSEEAKLAAKGAYKYLNNKLANSDNKITIKNGIGIGYVVPQYVNIENVEDDLLFKFRVKMPFKNSNLVIKKDGEIIKTIKKLSMLPAEMENIKLSKELMIGAKEISFEVNN